MCTNIYDVWLMQRIWVDFGHKELCYSIYLMRQEKLVDHFTQLFRQENQLKFSD